ncbi:ATP synthase F0 subunit C [Desulfoglaeba alkanexedens ALDC]|jgi:F-type H+-transporting ATPase subunit c|uniref:ATP synthase subunit c n=1 Tax=Desulfoglaeba alkanexedens ALDC TaxID=980445 RepID=A0A4P8L398_9BACT|nr:ATP synthase F0 subunit C [Desulfoglaeba alkanexedens]QCQ22338.1 ATP synthase F0 subunit C [Desulfoglaeba alkanexedens ALDC]
MSKKVGFLTVLLVLGLSTLALAAEAESAEKVAGLQFFIYSAVAAGFGIAIAAFGTGLGQGMAIKSSVEGVARNPEASGKITVTMMIGLAMIESLCIYALVIALILIYANPVSSLIQGFIGLAH